MLYILEPRTETDMIESVGLPDTDYAYGDNIVTYSDFESSESISPGKQVIINGETFMVSEVHSMKFGRACLKIVPVSKTTTGALKR